MANITERRKQDGRLSFYIRVYRGRGVDGKMLKAYTTTFEAEPTWSDKTARKKAEAFASVFEKECLEGTKVDTRITFRKYCDYVIELKENRGLKHSTIVRYKDLAKRINEQIGHIKLKDLRVDHLNSLYTYLSSDGLNKRSGGRLNNKTIYEGVLELRVILSNDELQVDTRVVKIPFDLLSRLLISLIAIFK
jgi:hypothetical protein